MKSDISAAQESQDAAAVIELSDSEPEMTTQPSTPMDTEGSNAVSAKSSLGTIEDGEGVYARL